MSVPKPVLYWQCPTCKTVTEGVNSRSTNYICADHHTPASCSQVEVHEVGTATELEALRAREIDWERYNSLDSEVERLRRIETRLDTVVLPEEHGNPTHRKYVKGCPYCEGWDDGIDVFRAAVLGGA